MNPIWAQIVIDTVKRNREARMRQRRSEWREAEEKAERRQRITIIEFLKDVLLISLGIASAAFGLKSFLLPNNFIDGGATGISLLISEITHVPIGVWLMVVNIPFLILGYNVISSHFTIKATISIIGLAAVISFFEFPQVTNDNLLVAIFGGFFLGAGIGLSVRGGAVLDGTEVLAIFVSRKFRATAGDVIIIINIFIFSAAAYFLSMDTALYSMLTYLAASKTLDFIIEGIEEYTGVTIISSHSNEIREMIINKLGRGVTVYKGTRGFGNHGEVGDIDIIYTVITRLEVNKLNTQVELIDKDAFIVMNSIKDTKGGMIKKRPLKD